MVVVPADIGIFFFTHFVEGAFPQAIDVCEDVCFTDEAEGVFFAFAASFFAVLAGVFECVFEAAVDLVSAVNGALDGDFVWGVFHC